MSPISTAATMNHEQDSLISPMTTPNELVDKGEASVPLEVDEFAGDPGTVVGGSSVVSHASSDGSSDYFKPDSTEHQHLYKDLYQQQQQQQQQQPTHRQNDSLCYSTDNDFDINTIESTSTISYLGSVVKALDVQQAFPSSMFPGQKLISPSTSQEAIGETAPRNSAYFYYSDSYQNSGGDGAVLRQPSSKTSHNVYQKRYKGMFWNDFDDDRDDIHEIEWEPSWKRCLRCFFSPRVALTLAVCAIIILNLMVRNHHSRDYLFHNTRNFWNLVRAPSIQTVRGSGNNNLFNGRSGNR